MEDQRRIPYMKYQRGIPSTREGSPLWDHLYGVLKQDAVHIVLDKDNLSRVVGKHYFHGVPKGDPLYGVPEEDPSMKY